MLLLVCRKFCKKSPSVIWIFFQQNWDDCEKKKKDLLVPPRWCHLSLAATSCFCVLANWRWQVRPSRRKFRSLGRRSCHSLGGGKKLVLSQTHSYVPCFTHTNRMCASWFCTCSELERFVSSEEINETMKHYNLAKRNTSVAVIWIMSSYTI